MNTTGPGASDDVCRQYENYPYPPRDPDDEKNRLIQTYLDTLAVLNHHCFAGRQTFRDGFRALVAGGGTGDALIHLAWQLRDTNAEIHYVDTSAASRDVARKRARARALENIVWHSRSLLDLPRMDLPKFDYINCIGVLHHLESPEEGLAALRGVLRDGGAMGLMVYGQIGRAGVYQLQDVLRRVCGDEPDDGARIAVAREVLGALPETNWFRHSWGWFGDHREMGDSGIYDLLLHARDRAYTVPQLHDLLASAGLRLVTYTADERVRLRPEFWLPEGPALDRVLALDPVQQGAVCELLCGSIIRHGFYASASAETAARLDDLDNAPFFLPGNPLVPNPLEAARTLQHIFGRAGGRTATLEYKGVKALLPTSCAAAAFFRHVDGQRTVSEILHLVRAELPERRSNEDLLADIQPTWDVLTLFDMLLLRHKSAASPALSGE